MIANNTSSQLSAWFSRGKYVFTLLAALLIIFALAACSSAGNSSTDAAVEAPEKGEEVANSTPETSTPKLVAEGESAPDFQVDTMDGKTVKLSDYKGKKVILNFWATWCGYCVDEMPALQKITENYSDVVVLTVTRNDETAKAKTFAEEKGYNFVWGLDESGEIASLYPSKGIPYSVIINEKGVVMKIFEGSAPDMYPYFEDALS